MLAKIGQVSLVSWVERQTCGSEKKYHCSSTHKSAGFKGTDGGPAFISAPGRWQSLTGTVIMSVLKAAQNANTAFSQIPVMSARLICVFSSLKYLCL